MIIVLLAVLGLLLGSFAGASVWRLRAWQLVEDKKEGYKVDQKELKRLKPLTGHSLTTDRSRCLECGHTLAWYDLIPLVSWLSTGGKCRYCRKSIGWFEPAIELATAGVFVALYTLWAYAPVVGPVWLLPLWLLAMMGLVILFIYDFRWFLLPNMVMWPLITVSGVIAAVRVAGQSSIAEALLSLCGSVAVLGGLYLLLYLYSRYRFGEEKTWVGFGDVKLGLALGLLLGDWRLALLALFLANFVGVLIVLPQLAMRKLSMKAHIPFGPLLIIGFLIALFAGTPIIDWYQQINLYFALIMMPLML